MMDLDRKDFLLMAVAAGGNTPLTPVQLQKSLFLISEHLTDLPETFYEFEPHHYGPFNKVVYLDADELEQNGLLFSVPSRNGKWLNKAITPAGLERAQELKSRLSPSSSAHIEALVEWMKPLSFSTLVKAIYTAYPEYRENSVFQD